MSGNCLNASRIPSPSWLSTYNGAACSVLKSADSNQILSTCCNTTANNIESHAAKNWTEVGALGGQTFGETESGSGCIYEYCNITYSNISSAHLAIDMFESCVETVFPEADNQSTCVSTTGGTDLPPSGAGMVAVSKTGLMVFLLAVVAMMV